MDFFFIIAFFKSTYQDFLPFDFKHFYFLFGFATREKGYSETCEKYSPHRLIQNDTFRFYGFFFFWRGGGGVCLSKSTVAQNLM